MLVSGPQKHSPNESQRQQPEELFLPEELSGEECGPSLSHPFFNFANANGLSLWSDLYKAAWAPLSVFCDHASRYFLDLSRTFPFNAVPAMGTAARYTAACYETFHRATKVYPEPPYNLNAEERDELVLPWASLKHFLPEGKQRGEPVLVVAPMTNNYPSLMRKVAGELINRGHDVSITHWKNAKLVPLSDGAFGLDKYVDYLLRFIDHYGERIHLVAVSQAGPPSLAAAALTHQLENRLKPRTLTVIASPMDTRINPSRINKIAGQHSVKWVREHCLDTVPAGYPGAGRLVYSGAAHLLNVYHQDFDVHLRRGWELFDAIVSGRDEEADKGRDYYDHFNARMDTDALFVLQTFDRVFKRHLLPRGKYDWRKMRVRPEEITETALLAVEGCQDTICSPGQTRAMLDWCPKLGPGMRAAETYDAGHNRVWNSEVWRTEVSPRVTRHIRRHAGRLHAVPCSAL